MNLETDLNDRHVVVTGAAGGIGTEIVKQFLNEGARVTASYHSKKRELEKLVDDYQNCLVLCKADLTKETDVKNLFDYANSEYARIDLFLTQG